VLHFKLETAALIKPRREAASAWTIILAPEAGLSCPKVHASNAGTE
jgi:hypothetical protein